MGIRLAIEFVGRNALVELAVVGVVVRDDVELFTFTGAIAKLEGLLPVLLRKLGLPQIVVDGTKPGVSHSEIGIEVDGALVVGDGGDIVTGAVLGISEGESLEGIE